MPISTRLSVPNVRSRTALSTTATAITALDSRRTILSQNVEKKKEKTREFNFKINSGQSQQIT